MADNFDPYHRWLGIPPDEQPPNHYRLLGLTLFEDNSDVIWDAAERQMAHVRTYQLGPHVELSQQILNELAAAKVCLFDPAKKTAYDARLRSRAEQTPPSAAPGPAAATGRPVLVAGVVAAGVLAIVFAVVALLSSRKDAPPVPEKTAIATPSAKGQSKGEDRSKSEAAEPSSEPASPRPAPKPIVAPAAPPVTPAPIAPPAPVETAARPEPASSSPPPPAPGPEPLQAAKTRLEQALREAKTPADFQTVGNDALAAAERAFATGDVAGGKAVATIAISASRSSGDTELMRRAALAFVKGPERARPQGKP
jgi:hypothetical protein